MADEPGRETTDSERDLISRRSVLGGAAAAAVGGVAVAAGGSAAFASNQSDDHHTGVARGPEGTTVVEFRGRIAQTGNTGEDFTSFGYLTRLNGASNSDLFSGTPHSETTALFTAYATGSLVARLFDQDVHQLDVVGDLTVYQRSASGATFADPDSFRQGVAVATYALEIQDVLSVFAPGKGILSMTGDMRQTKAGKLAGGLAGKRFGHVHQRLRQSASGLGTLLNAQTSNSSLEVAGNWAAV